MSSLWIFFYIVGPLRGVSIISILCLALCLDSSYYWVTPACVILTEVFFKDLERSFLQFSLFLPEIASLSSFFLDVNFYAGSVHHVFPFWSFFLATE